ncbi:fibronectin type III-like domain-contianing protein [Streptomyces panacea]|uniref:fibronectin type III-like domain-contianing protein n=1 Tax=Streptomyces panacea TaxID=3035064 RepID=UPI003F4A3693
MRCSALSAGPLMTERGGRRPVTTHPLRAKSADVEPRASPGVLGHHGDFARRKGDRAGRVDARQVSKYLDLAKGPEFTFGHGLSYTTFALGDPLLSRERIGSRELREGATVTVTVPIRNTGDREGDDVVQLYAQDPAAAITQPVRRLRGFLRVQAGGGGGAGGPLHPGGRRRRLLDQRPGRDLHRGTGRDPHPHRRQLADPGRTHPPHHLIT